MRKKKKDYNDLPREELMRRAQETIEQFRDYGQEVEIYFKFTCEKCGERCVLKEVNTLRESGECCECGHTTEIKKGGFMLQLTLFKTDSKK